MRPTRQGALNLDGAFEQAGAILDCAGRAPAATALSERRNSTANYANHANGTPGNRPVRWGEAPDEPGAAQKQGHRLLPRETQGTQNSIVSGLCSLRSFAAFGFGGGFAYLVCFAVHFKSGVALAPWDEKAYADGEVPSQISHGASLPPHSKTHWVCVGPSSKQGRFWTAPAERQRRRRFRQARGVRWFNTLPKSGVALRLPPHSKTLWICV